jgi:hypothetical protein
MPSWSPAGVTIKIRPTNIPTVVQAHRADLKRFATLFGN